MSFELKYPHLFQPIVLGKTVFRNRIFGSPTGYQNLSSEQFPSPEVWDYFERKARGGAASVAVGEALPDTELGKGGPNHMPMDNPEIVGPLTQLSLAISKWGAVPVLELQHAGMFAEQAKVEFGSTLYGPVDMEPQRGEVVHSEEFTSHDETDRIHAMPEELIYRTIEKYGDAAARAKACGFGMILIHGGHGWMMSQWLSPIINKRTDQWGGSFENRMRLPLAIIENIRKKCGKHFPIEFRMSVTEANSKGYGVDEGIQIAKALDGKVDLIHASVGNHEVREAFVVTHPSLFMPDGVNSYLAAEVKKNVSTPVATVGAFTEPELMEEIIASGKADVVDVARGLIADPDLPNKARQGKAEDITRCLRCFTCFSYILTNELLCCAVNPEIGQELESRFEAPPAKSSKKVLIAGGGIGGMQAALTAVERGHKVILCEKSGELGGVLRCERKVPFKEKLDGYLDLQARRVKEAGVDIRLNTEVTAEYAAAEDADVVIAAMGARPVKPPIPGIDGDNVVSAEYAYVNPEKTGDKVVMLGAGFVGTELGLYLRGMGKEVTVIEMMPGITDGGNILHGLAVDVKMKETGVVTRFNTKAVEITDAGVATENVVTGEKVLYEADTVIYAVGQRALGEEPDALLATAPEFYKIGDCVSPKNIREATRSGYYAAKNIASI